MIYFPRIENYTNCLPQLNVQNIRQYFPYVLAAGAGATTLYVSLNKRNCELISLARALIVDWLGAYLVYRQLYSLSKTSLEQDQGKRKEKVTAALNSLKTIILGFGAIRLANETAYALFKTQLLYHLFTNNQKLTVDLFVKGLLKIGAILNAIGYEIPFGLALFQIFFSLEKKTDEAVKVVADFIRTVQKPSIIFNFLVEAVKKLHKENGDIVESIIEEMDTLDAIKASDEQIENFFKVRLPFVYKNEDLERLIERFPRILTFYFLSDNLPDEKIKEVLTPKLQSFNKEKILLISDNLTNWQQLVAKAEKEPDLKNNLPLLGDLQEVHKEIVEASKYIAQLKSILFLVSKEYPNNQELIKHIKILKDQAKELCQFIKDHSSLLQQSGKEIDEKKMKEVDRITLCISGFEEELKKAEQAAGLNENSQWSKRLQEIYEELNENCIYLCRRSATDHRTNRKLIDEIMNHKKDIETCFNAISVSTATKQENILMRIKKLLQSIKEKKIEDDLDDDIFVSLGPYGFTLEFCTKLLTELDLPIGDNAFKTVETLLKQKGIETRKDLLDQKILPKKGETLSEQGLKNRLEKLLAGGLNKVTPSKVREVQKIAKFAFHYLVPAFFIGVQIYRFPKATIGGIIFSKIGQSERINRFFIRGAFLTNLILFTRYKIKVLKNDTLSTIYDFVSLWQNGPSEIFEQNGSPIHLPSVWQIYDHDFSWLNMIRELSDKIEWVGDSNGVEGAFRAGVLHNIAIDTYRKLLLIKFAQWIRRSPSQT